ncbi:MAG: hypothetical protein ACI9G1_004649 [Pirellulaceae bacterium]|jgi:hypothetical protein
MNEILLHYETVNPISWAYLSSLLMIGLFFKFGRFWSVRNLDLILLILFAPGLLLFHFGRQAEVQAIETMAQERALENILEDQPEPEKIPAAALEGAIGEPAGTEPNDEPNDEPNGDDPDVDQPANEPLESDSTAAASDVSPIGLDPADGREVDSTGTDERSIGNSESNSPLVEAETNSTIGDTNPEPSEGEDIAGEEEAILTPGQQAFEASHATQRNGFVWLFIISALMLVRLLVDPTMVRRPLLEPNLSTGGLAFIGCSLFVFLMGNVISSTPSEDDLNGPRRAEQLLSGESDEKDGEEYWKHGPGYAWLNVLPSIPTMPLLRGGEKTAEAEQAAYATAAKTMAILAHLAIVIGVVAVGYVHFDSIKMGIGAATLYLMLPYTAQMTGRILHVIPAALMVWAIFCYRRPLTSGIFLGLAIGVVYYPLFLLPLWISFYWQRGLGRFLIGASSVLTLMVLSLLFREAPFVHSVRQMFGMWWPVISDLEGIWGLGWYAVYRIPVIAAFGTLCGALALWPAQKNLGTLLSCSGAVMVATQFWHGHGGGLYMAWFLPLVLLTIFRPNLEDRVALTVLGEGWTPKWKRHDSKAA